MKYQSSWVYFLKCRDSSDVEESRTDSGRFPQSDCATIGDFAIQHFPGIGPSIVYESGLSWDL